MAMDERSGSGKRRRKKRLNLEDDMKEEDIISDLPDSILHHILSFLPSTKESIKTGILSKRWQNQWTRVPVLVFDFSGKPSDHDSVEDFARSIDSTLLQHDCSKIKKLHLAYNFKKDSNFSSKIRFATKTHVEELILNCYNGDPKLGYMLPKFLFDNSFLVKLEMMNCCFKYDWTINWGSLKAFKMNGCTSKKLVANVLQGSPSLESLEIINTRGITNSYVIASKSLKVLVLENVKKIEISCPNLEELSVKSLDEYDSSHKVIESVVSGCRFLRSLELYKYTVDKLFIASNSLKKLVLEDLYTACKFEISCPNLEEFKSNGLHHETFKLMNVPTQYDGCNYEDKAKRIFQQIQYVDKLKIGSWFIKILSDVGMRGLSYPWDYNKSMTLYGPDFEHLPGIICALRSSRKLEKLIINLQVHQGGKNSISYDFSTKNIGLHLETVEIIGLSKKDDKYKLVLCFIEFILKCAKVLKKLVLVITKDGGPDFAVKVSQEVSSYPRSSKHAIVELLCF